MVLIHRRAQNQMEQDERSLFAKYRAASKDDERRLHRQTIVHKYAHLAYSLARRYRHRGEAAEDLNQVALAALVAAIDRFDPDRGFPFGSFAYSSIKGELKRHFRNNGWAMRVPRSLQELALLLAVYDRDLVQKLGRSPTPAELARECGETEEDILLAIDVSRNYNVMSLDAPLEINSGGQGSVVDMLGFEDERFDRSDYLAELPDALEKLTQTEREIVYFRFFEGELQWQIAQRFGVSQMQVSRLIRRALEKLRSELEVAGDNDTNPLL